jgi:ankyrin repeat protein
MSKVDELFDNIKSGKLEAMKSLIPELGLNARDGWKNTALQQASYYKQQEIVEFLVEAGAELDPSSLICACSMGHPEIALFLIDKGIAVNVQDGHGMTALMWAAGRAAGVVGRLLEAGAKTEIKDNEGMSAMMHAGSAAVVKILIEQGLNIEEQNKYQKSALSLAAGYGKTKAVAGYLAHGADIHSLDKYENTPLINAAIGEHEDTVALLLEKGADTSAKNDSDRTALAESLLRKNKKVQDLLIAATKIDIFDAVRIGRLALLKKLSKTESLKSKNSSGDTLLMTAAYWQHLSVVKYLVAQGLDVNASNKHGWSVLRMPCYQPSGKALKIMKFLVENGADIDAVDSTNETVLFYSANYPKNNKISQFLIDAGANLEKADKWGNTALMVACKAGNGKLVKVLLEKGADKDAKNNAGKSITDIVEEALKLAKGGWNRSLTAKLNKVVKLLK